MKEEWHYGAIDYVCDITGIPVPDGAFDVVLCTEVLEHVPEPLKALRELSRVLRDGGWLFLSAPLGSGYHQPPFHYYGGFTPAFYRLFLPELGFQIEDLKPNGGFFKHYLQETARAARIILSQENSKRFAILRPIVAFVGLRLAPTLLYQLDGKIFIEEFTVGYFVKAQKRATTSTGT